MPHPRAVVEQGGIAVTALLVVFINLEDARLCKPEDLIVVAVSEFVEDDPGLLVDVSGDEHFGGFGDVDALRTVGVVAVLNQPVHIGMILHRVQLAVDQVEHDVDGPHLRQSLRGHDIGDVREFGIEELEGALAERLIGRLQQAVVHAHRPAFELARSAGGGPGSHRRIGGMDGGGCLEKERCHERSAETGWK